jgi:hypothetical protein
MSKRLTIRNSTAEFLIFQAQSQANGVEVFYQDEMLWLTQKAMSTLFDVDRTVITKHLKNIFESEELQMDSVCAKFAHTAEDGKTYSTQFYNLDAVISVGYRVNSTRATQFRQWATAVLRQFAIRGYVLDKKRMENGAFLTEDYFEHLLAEIREIRLSERRMYQKVTDLYATAIDYNKDAPTTRRFFAKVQNKLHWAIVGQTAAEIIYSNADASKQNMGLTTWAQAPDGKILKSDVAIAKNYLSEEHMRELNRLVEAYINLAETRAKNHRPTTMQQWAEFLDNFLTLASYPILMDKGKISALQAKLKAYEEYDKYRVIQDRLYMSDFDKEVKRLKDEMGMEL